MHGRLTSSANCAISEGFHMNASTFSAPYRLVVGKGGDTRCRILSSGKPNPSVHAGEDYVSVSLLQLMAVFRAPYRLPEEIAPWFIPSEYCRSDARERKSQEQNGIFHFLSVRIDEGNHDLEAVLNALGRVCPAVTIVYSTQCATQDKKKWMGLIKLARPIAGGVYSATADALYDLIEDDGLLKPVRSMANPAQIIHLPNRGKFFQMKTVVAPELDLVGGHPVIVRRSQNSNRMQEDLGANDLDSAREHIKAAPKERLAQDAEKDEELCQGDLFMVNRDGVFKRETVFDRRKKINVDKWTFVCSELRILADTRDIHGDEWGRLLEIVDRDGTKKTWSMPMSLMAGDGAHIRERLFALGLVLQPSAAAKQSLLEYVATSEPQERVRCVARIGWIGNAFVLPSKTIGEY